MAALPVLFIDHAEALGGAERILLLLLEEIDRRRFTPHLVAPRGALTAAAAAAGVTVHELALPRLRGAPAAPWRLARTGALLARLIEREGIAAVCAHSIRGSIYAAAAAALARRAFVWHLHEQGTWLYRRLVCMRCDVAIAVSASVAACVPCRHKVRVIHNGIRAADFAGDHLRARAAGLRAAWGVPQDAQLIGHVARLEPWKGQRDVIAAAEMLLRTYPDVYVAMIGGDIFHDAAAYEREIRASVVQRGLTARIVFTGHQVDVPAVFAALDMLVHASFNEPFGTVLLEGGAAGLPIVAYGGGGVPEVLVHEETGLLVVPGDVAGLATALNRLVSDRTLGRTLGAAARARVRQDFDVSRMARDVEAVLADVLHPASGRS